MHEWTNPHSGFNSKFEIRNWTGDVRIVAGHRPPLLELIQSKFFKRPHYRIFRDVGTLVRSCQAVGSRAMTSVLNRIKDFDRLASLRLLEIPRVFKMRNG